VSALLESRSSVTNKHISRDSSYSIVTPALTVTQPDKSNRDTFAVFKIFAEEKKAPRCRRNERVLQSANSTA